SSPFKCFGIGRFETPKSRVATPTVAGPRASRSTIPRRIGCATALNASLAIQVTMPGQDPAPQSAPQWLGVGGEYTAQCINWGGARRDEVQGREDHRGTSAASCSTWSCSSWPCGVLTNPSSRLATCSGCPEIIAAELLPGGCRPQMARAT